MKKIAIILFFGFLLTSCFWDSDEVIKAKQDLGVIQWTSIEESVENNEGSIAIPTMWDLMDIKGDPRIKITQISGEKLLELWDLDYDEFKTWYSKITGTTLGQVDKIIVSFSNEESEFPSDWFTLKKFKGWDTTFEYNASSKFKVLDFGVNQYRFVAYSGTQKSILELLVVVSEDDKRVLEWNASVWDYEESVENVTTQEDTEENVYEELADGDLPKGWDFWDIVKLWGSSFTYSDIKGLEINTVTDTSIDCSDIDGVTSYIKENIAKWPYWNTCRSILKENWVYLYVTKMDQNEYVYEKHYIDPKHWLHWSFELERGELYSTEDELSVTERDSLLWDKNKELKSKNDDFTQQSITDSLFKKIAQ